MYVQMLLESLPSPVPEETVWVRHEDREYRSEGPQQKGGQEVSQPGGQRQQIVNFRWIACDDRLSKQGRMSNEYSENNPIEVSISSSLNHSTSTRWFFSIKGISLVFV